MASLASSPVQLVEAVDRDQQSCHQPDSASIFCTHAHVPQKSPANFTCKLGTCLGFASMLSRSLFPSPDLDSRRYSSLRQVLPSLSLKPVHCASLSPSSVRLRKVHVPTVESESIRYRERESAEAELASPLSRLVSPCLGSLSPNACSSFRSEPPSTTPVEDI